MPCADDHLILANGRMRHSGTARHGGSGERVLVMPGHRAEIGGGDGGPPIASVLAIFVHGGSSMRVFTLAANESPASSRTFEVRSEGGGVPEVDGAILGRGGEPGAVGGEGNPPHPLGVPFQLRDAAARVDVP